MALIRFETNGLNVAAGYDTQCKKGQPWWINAYDETEELELHATLPREDAEDLVRFLQEYLGVTK